MNSAFTIPTTPYILGLEELTSETKHVCICLHGYRQRIDYFSRWFDQIEEVCCVFPEALHRFYIEGFRGKIGASWMTSYRREEDIDRNHTYLSQLLNTIRKCAPNARISAIGFSQGAQVLSRWVLEEQVVLEHMYLIGGFPAEDIQESQWLSIDFPVIQYFGNNDAFYTFEALAKQRKNNPTWNKYMRWKEYDGEHTVTRTLWNDIIQDILTKA